MTTPSMSIHVVRRGEHPVRLHVPDAPQHRNRLTVGFRWLLAIPHLILVGGPAFALFTWASSNSGTNRLEFGTAGVLGVAMCVVTIVVWFSIVFGAGHPRQLWLLAAMYLRWRAHVASYVALLRDEYPPFGEGAYPVELELPAPEESRDRVAVAFRLLLAVPQLIAVWLIGMLWALATIASWIVILFTGRHPRVLYDFAVHALQYTLRVEAYLLLLRDEYPPFSFSA